MAEAQGLIRDRFGERYGTGKGRVYRTKAKGAQEAHESIRPTSFRRDPESLRGTLKAEEYRLYRLIWQRALASQMAPKELETTTVELAAADYRLRASATRTLFDGFARVYTEGQDDAAEEAERTLPPLAVGDATRVLDVTPSQHFTEPPPRYTEATLIKALEEHGIGRPSTYAATISTIVDRGYVRIEERRLHPEEIGEIVTDLWSSTSASTWTSRSRRGWRSSTRSPAASARVPCCAFFDPLKAAWTEGARSSNAARLHDRAVRRGLLTGPSDGHSAGS
jgi:DNA topoisomerase-1